MRRVWILPLIAVLVIALDQASKQWIRINADPGEVLVEAGRLTIVHVCNSGAAFGILQGHSVMLSMLALIAIIVMIAFYRQITGQSAWYTLTLGLVMGGAAGNLADRLRLGCVTDFIDIRLWGDYHWPAFNVADSAISVGIVLLVVLVITGLKQEDGKSF